MAKIKNVCRVIEKKRQDVNLSNKKSSGWTLTTSLLKGGTACRCYAFLFENKKSRY
jgi:hypothetical protein